MPGNQGQAPSLNRGVPDPVVSKVSQALSVPGALLGFVEANRDQLWRTVHSTYDKIGLAKQWWGRRNEAFQQHAPPWSAIMRTHALALMMRRTPASAT